MTCNHKVFHFNSLSTKNCFFTIVTFFVCISIAQEIPTESYESTETNFISAKITRSLCEQWPKFHLQLVLDSFGPVS